MNVIRIYEFDNIKFNICLKLVQLAFLYVIKGVKEKSCYVALNYNNELNKSRESIKYSVDLKDFDPNFK